MAFVLVGILAPSLPLLRNHTTPEPTGRHDFVSVGEDQISSLDPSGDTKVELHSDAGPSSKLDSEETDSPSCQRSVSTPPSGREDVPTDPDQSDSGEFVVTMLAKAKLEEQGIGVKGRSSPLIEAGIQEASALASHRDEDVTADSWRQHRKHVFVLSEAGKPIYSRYGSEEALSSTMGVMMALVSFVQSGDNIIRSVYTGESISGFICVSKWFIEHDGYEKASIFSMNRCKMKNRHIRALLSFVNIESTNQHLFIYFL